MPAGKIRYKDGSSEWYDDVDACEGVTVIKTSYNHKVKGIPTSSIKSIETGEWHRTPFGWCKQLSSDEIKAARGHLRHRHK